MHSRHKQGCLNLPHPLLITPRKNRPFHFRICWNWSCAAIRIKHGRNEITAESVRGILSAIEKDMAEGVLVRPDYEPDEVFRHAEMVSSRHAVYPKKENGIAV